MSAFRRPLPAHRSIEPRGRGLSTHPRRWVGLVASVLVVTAAACGSVPPAGSPSDDPPSADPSGATSAVPSQAAESSAEGGAETCEYVQSGKAAKPVELPKATDVLRSGTLAYVITTNEGDVKITMNRAKAPCTINSFDSLASQGYYNDTKCHRLVDAGLFILQCGDPTATGRGGPGYTYADETDGTEKYPAGTVAMANAGPNTNGSQFFLVYADTPLPADYTVFATMDKAGLGVVNRIAAEGQGGDSVPNNPAEIVSVTK